MNRQHLLNCIDKTMLDNLYGFCYRRTSDHYEADELCSDILLAVAAASARGGEISDPTAFLWKIAHNVYADFSERRRKRAETEGLLDPDITPDDVADEDEEEIAALRDERLSAIYRQIAFLGRAYRDVMIAFYLDGIPIAEIAKRENTSVGAIKQRLFSAREKIKGEVTTMTTVNEKAMKLQPMHWNIWGTGNPNTGEAAAHCNRQFSRHLVWLCRKQARTAKELSELLCVPMSYVEEELEIQRFGRSGYGMLRMTEDGKYISNVILFDRAEIAAAQKIYLDRIPALCDAI
ncbi:MAG: RNA polymerase sigma factor, partial [Clostridia bacterium]|nr:RNA polymerase sigma factor [Clostridia bacterium]